MDTTTDIAVIFAEEGDDCTEFSDPVVVSNGAASLINL